MNGSQMPRGEGVSWLPLPAPSAAIHSSAKLYTTAGNSGIARAVVELPARCDPLGWLRPQRSTAVNVAAAQHSAWGVITEVIPIMAWRRIKLGRLTAEPAADGSAPRLRIPPPAAETG